MYKICVSAMAGLSLPALRTGPWSRQAAQKGSGKMLPSNWVWKLQQGSCDLAAR